MSIILIKGMEMPKSCEYCDLCSDDGYCMAMGGDSLWDVLPEEAEYFPTGWKYEGCPLVEVLAPHGRLIDENNVIDAIHERLRVLQTHEVFRKKHGDIDLLGVMPYIAKIPTVIEAEDGDTE